jgi:hypothetical protein
VYLQSAVNDNVLDEAMSRDLSGRNKQPQECSGLHHGRHFEDRMVVIGRLDCKERIFVAEKVRPATNREYAWRRQDVK